MSHMKVHRFSSTNEVYDELERIIQDKGESAHISPILMRNYAKIGLEDWEQKSKLDVLDLFDQSFERRKEEIPKMIQSIRPYIGTALDTRKEIREVLEDIEEAFREIYGLKQW